jgi:predicted dehydrogenase
MARIGLIGGLGIAKAHGIAALNLGHDIIWVIDREDALPQVVKTYNDVLRNEWGPVKEEAKLTGPVAVTSSLDALRYLPQVDLAIVCSPNDLHAEHVKACLRFGTVKRVLVEKPASLYVGLASEDWAGMSSVSVGHKWKYHPTVHDVLMDGVKFYCQFHDHPPQRGWKDTIIEDLGSHALAGLLHAHHPGGYDVRLLSESAWYALFSATPWGTNQYNYGLVMYEPSKHGVLAVDGHSTSEDVYSGEVYLKGRDGVGHMIAWDDNIFQWQIEGALNGDVRTPYATQGRALDLAVQKLQNPPGFMRLNDDLDAYSLASFIQNQTCAGVKLEVK